MISLVGALDLGLPIDESLAQARFHHQWIPDELLVEEKMPAGVVEQLKALGHQVKTTKVLAAAQMAGANPEGTLLFGASDPRVPGGALGFSKEAAPAK